LLNIIMGKKELTKTGKTLLWMCAGIGALENFIITPNEFRKRGMSGKLFKDTPNANSFLNYLFRKGYIQFVDKNNERFVKITKKGELKILLAKSQISKKKNWDGKWRVIIFDIPEESREARNRFRHMIKNLNYTQLQASVFVSPYPINKEAVEYLKKTGLIKYIRFLKVEEIDDDSGLRKFFKVG
jgi:hypothetical protein